MQSWSNTGQNGDEQWQTTYDFTGQNGQFDPHQAWSQPVDDQSLFAQINPQDASTSAFFASAHQGDGNAFLAGNLHASPSPQPGFQAGHDSLALNTQFSQPGQDVIDPAFSDMHPDIYGQSGKVNHGDSLNHLGNVQPHGQSQPFSYSFPQSEQSFDSPIQPYGQPHVMAQQGRQQSHTPVEHFEGLPHAYNHGHGFSRPPQQSPGPAQAAYAGSTFQSPVAEQPQYQVDSQSHYQQAHQQPSTQAQQQPQQQPPSYSQPSYVHQKPLAYTQSPQGVPNPAFQQPIHHTSTLAPSSTSSPATDAQYGTPSQLVDSDASTPQPVAVESQAKKRKRATRTATDAPTPEPVTTFADSPGDSMKRVEEIDALVVPLPSAEDAQLLAQFNKRSKALQVKRPSIKGLPYLVHDTSTKLPAPKSYDKLAPLVALPPRTGKAIVPELGYSLPCEVQGRFTSQYRPSPDKGGLDERRIEAKALLDDFDRSMKALGKRRPKYTEYPHAFKEQLKSDEASKNKAEKKAKKELEGDRSKPIRDAVRPLDPAQAAAWDAIGIVHIDQGVARTNTLIASRVQQAGEFFIKLRGEMNRAKQDLDQAIKDKEPEVEVAKLRHEADQKKKALFLALDSTLEHADDAVLDNLGGHQKFVLSLVNALIMCIKSSDFSGKLPKAVLELFTQFTMTKRIAETTNFETVRKRFADKGDDEVKVLVQEITAKIKKALKSAEPDTATGYTGTSAASRAKATTKSSDGSTKRGRDEESDARTVKKIAVESTGSSLSKKLAHPKIQLQSASKTTAAKAAASSILPGKSRPVAKSIPKPEPVKADVKAAGDEKTKVENRNGVKTDTSKPAPAKTEVKPPSVKPSAMSSASAWSGIGSLLDSINAPKPESPVVVPRDAKSPDSSETSEERSKRLRKESRRKLRVSWKPEGELVQIKIFQKEENEDEGREVNMIRDAGDDRSEGMVLKQRANVEDEDDDDDLPYQPWIGPTATDVSNLPEDQRNKNFVTRGGHVGFTTDEQQRIAEREQRELMAIYAQPDDIPPTPKSPPPEMVVDTETKTNQLPADEAKFQELQLRWRDEQQMGLDGALYAAVKRLDAKENPSNRLDSILGRLKGASPTSQPQQKAATTAQPTSSSSPLSLPLIAGPAVEGQVLDILRSDATKAWRDPAPSHTDVWRAFQYADPVVHLSGNAIEIVARSLAGKPFPATSPPDWIQHDQEKIREWQLGYSKEVAARQKKADEERARAEAEANALRAAAAQAAPNQGAGQGDWAAYYAQQQAYAPYLALLQQMNGGQQAAPQNTGAPAAPAQQPQIPDTQLQSILAAINQPQQQTAEAQPASYLNPNDPSYQQYMMLQQMTRGQQAPPPPPPPPPPPTAERDWDRGDDHQRRDERDRDRGDKDPRRKRATLPPHKPANKALIGTKPCTFWQQGKCARGDKCTFRHD